MIIGLLGSAGAGKTTAARMIADILGAEDVEILQVAAPIKAMLLGLGLQPEDFNPRTKERPIGWIGASPRHLMQTLGDWGSGVNQTLWTGILETRMTTLLLKGVPHLIVEDIRLPLEASLVKRSNGVLIRITRPKLVVAGAHVTERAGQMIDVDHEIENSGSLDQLRMALEEVLVDAT